MSQTNLRRKMKPVNCVLFQKYKRIQSLVYIAIYLFNNGTTNVSESR